MGQGSLIHRRQLLGQMVAGAAGWSAALAPLISGCSDVKSMDTLRPEVLAGAAWVGTSPERGHRLRQAQVAVPSGLPTRRVGALVLGGGVAGLSALRALTAQGVQDACLLELEDEVGGNSRSTRLGEQLCPIGAHYLPVPGEAAVEVRAWLHEIGLLHHDGLRGRSVPLERHLAHAPQERLFFQGAWQDGLLPLDVDAATRHAYQRFAAAVAQARRLGFSIPSLRSPWTPAHQALDQRRFSEWLLQSELTAPPLLAYLDYACRDDFGAGLDQVSAWAGLHYFASRHGFKLPASLGPSEADEEEGGLFTWPQGNAWLVERLAKPHFDRLHTGRVVRRVESLKHGVEVLAWSEAAQAWERWQAPIAVLALPLFAVARVWVNPPPAVEQALRVAVQTAQYAPWLVTQLRLDEALIDRPGVGPAWDNVGHAPAGQTRSLGYVDAQHQSLRPDRSDHTGPTVLTAYHALPTHQRAELLQAPASLWAQRVVADLAQLHADLPAKIGALQLTRHGHAMRIPTPGTRGMPELEILRAIGRQPGQRIRLAHADLVGYSVFEEAFTLGTWAGAAPLPSSGKM